MVCCHQALGDNLSSENPLLGKQAVSCKDQLVGSARSNLGKYVGKASQAMFLFWGIGWAVTEFSE